MKAPKLSKEEYHALATAGARALLVEMKTKEVALLGVFPELKGVMEGPVGKKQLKGTRTERMAERLAWVRSRQQVTVDDMVARFGLNRSAANVALIVYTQKKILRRLSPGVYTAQKALKAA